MQLDRRRSALVVEQDSIVHTQTGTMNFHVNLVIIPLVMHHLVKCVPLDTSVHFRIKLSETSVQMEHIPWVLRSSVRSVSQAASVLQSLKALLFVDQDISVNGMLQCAGCVRLGNSVPILHLLSLVLQGIIPALDRFSVYLARGDLGAKKDRRLTAPLKMCVQKVDGVMDGHFSPAHLELITLLMVHNHRKPAGHVHQVTSVRTVAQLITDPLSVEWDITVLWGLNFETSSPAHQVHTTPTSTRLLAPSHVYPAPLVITV